jgi:hypothetical protein
MYNKPQVYYALDNDSGGGGVATPDGATATQTANGRATKTPAENVATGDDTEKHISCFLCLVCIIISIK